jgi:hypothetical protein
LQQLYLGGLCLVRRSYCLVTFDSSELVLIKILYFGSNLLNVGYKPSGEIFGKIGYNGQVQALEIK